ncbi:MAG: hypothetical protein OHK0015_03110 [Chloroflexi bacterium OHK40]
MATLLELLAIWYLLLRRINGALSRVYPIGGAGARLTTIGDRGCRGGRNGCSER